MSRDDLVIAAPVIIDPASARTGGWTRLLAWPRIRFALIFAVAVGFPLDLVINGGRPWYLLRTLALGTAALAAFGLFEQWPRRLPRPLARWVLQVLGVALAMPLTTFPIWVMSTKAGAGAFWTSQDELLNFAMLTLLSLLLAPWAALAALVRQKDALARHQALAFDLERSELGRRALDARLQLLKAQVAPHFLFNTLANVQALVDTGSPRASAVLGSLIAYLRAAVPRLHETATTLGQEVQLVQAYLELMHTRMPDRLQFALDVDEAARGLRCPPMTLLTLAENAVRHGIDPSEEGGRIDIEVRREDGRCRVRVTDTGAGFHTGGDGLGTGLATLRERIRLSFAGDAQLRLSEHEPHGVRAELDFPAEDAGAQARMA
jgi:signal transduction histidine kinase